MRGRKPAQPARKALSVRLASLGSRLGARTAVLAAAGLVALVLVFWLWPSSQRIEKGQKAELPDLRDGIPKAIATHQWPQAEASIAKLEQLAPTDLRAAEWSKQVVTGRALDALRSSIQSSIRAQDWATAEVQIADLKAKAPDDPQAPEWQATVDQGRQAGIPTQTEQKAETEPIWPVEGGDARCSGYASSRGPRNPKESWDVQAPSTESHSPLIGPEGRVYISVTEGAGAGQARQLWCVAANSSILWKTPIGPSDRVGFAPDGSVQLKSARRTRTLNRDGGVSADASSDNSWIGFRLLGGHRYSSGGSAPNGYCQRLDDPQWRTDLDGDTSGGWAMDDRGSIYVGTHRGTLYALSDTGRVIWRKNISGVDSFNGLAVTADRDVLAATGPAGSAGDARVRDAAALLCVRDGQVRWKYATDDAHVTAPIHDVTGTIFFGSGTKLYALSSAGQELWGLDLHDTLTSQAAMDKNGRIYVSTMKGLYCISETPRN
jgi:outer membrane protein assembly factor BamB